MSDFLVRKKGSHFCPLIECLWFVTICGSVVVDSTSLISNEVAICCGILYTCTHISVATATSYRVYLNLESIWFDKEHILPVLFFLSSHNR